MSVFSFLWKLSKYPSYFMVHPDWGHTYEDINWSLWTLRADGINFRKKRISITFRYLNNWKPEVVIMAPFSRVVASTVICMTTWPIFFSITFVRVGLVLYLQNWICGVYVSLPFFAFAKKHGTRTLLEPCNEAFVQRQYILHRKWHFVSKYVIYSQAAIYVMRTLHDQGWGLLKLRSLISP